MWETVDTSHMDEMSKSSFVPAKKKRHPLPATKKDVPNPKKTQTTSSPVKTSIKSPKPAKKAGNNNSSKKNKSVAIENKRTESFDESSQATLVEVS